MTQCGTRNGYAAHRRRGDAACEPCLAAMRAYNRQYQQVRPTVADGWTPPVHGKRWVYARGCRCDSCRTAASEYTRVGGHNKTAQARRHAERQLVGGRLVHPDPWGGHGSLAAYTTCGCRCDLCRGAKAAYERGRR